MTQREILFRGQTRRYGEKVRVGDGEKLPSNWVYGGVLQGGGPFSIIYNDKFVKYPVYTDTLGQYTGLTDANEEKIFEGDILRFSYTGKNRGVEGVATVVFKRGKFGVEWGWHKELVCIDGFANTKIEVIGNIYDNPELLEVGE